jgi:hypothetical protein
MPQRQEKETRVMDYEGFRAHLRGREVPEDEIERSISVVERFEAFLGEPERSRDLASATKADVDAFSAILVGEGANSWERYVAIARYGRFVDNDTVYVAVLEYIDGFEALGNLHARLKESLGEKERDRVFSGIDLPPLGTPNEHKHASMRTAVRRLEETVGHDRCARILGDGLRDLPDASFVEERRKYEQAGGIDAYLALKGDEFVAQLERIRDTGTLYFTQPITDEVIGFVNAHPEIRQGVRVGSVIYEAKIPYAAVEFLRETSPGRRAYYYCHCPWARESLRDGEEKVPATFCNCSAAFHKKPYEVIFGRRLEAEVIESVLAGDRWCKFAIHLPEEAL